MKKMKLYFENLGNLFKIQNMGRFVKFLFVTIRKEPCICIFEIKKRTK